MSDKVDKAAKAVQRATHELIDAARQGDPSAIDRAILARQTAAEQLQAAWNQSGVALEERKSWLQTLTMQVDDAARELTDLQIRVRDELRSIYGGVRAARGYAAKSREGSSALDRAG